MATKAIVVASSVGSSPPLEATLTTRRLAKEVKVFFEIDIEPVTGSPHGPWTFSVPAKDKDELKATKLALSIDGEVVRIAFKLVEPTTAAPPVHAPPPAPAPLLPPSQLPVATAAPAAVDDPSEDPSRALSHANAGSGHHSAAAQSTVPPPLLTTQPPQRAPLQGSAPASVSAPSAATTLCFPTVISLSELLAKAFPAVTAVPLHLSTALLCLRHNIGGLLRQLALMPGVAITHRPTQDAIAISGPPALRAQAELALLTKINAMKSVAIDFPTLPGSSRAFPSFFTSSLVSFLSDLAESGNQTIGFVVLDTTAAAGAGTAPVESKVVFFVEMKRSVHCCFFPLVAAKSPAALVKVETFVKAYRAILFYPPPLAAAGTGTGPGSLSFSLYKMMADKAWVENFRKEHGLAAFCVNNASKGFVFPTRIINSAFASHSPSPSTHGVFLCGSETDAELAAVALQHLLGSAPAPQEVVAAAVSAVSSAPIDAASAGAPVPTVPAVPTVAAGPAAASSTLAVAVHLRPELTGLLCVVSTASFYQADVARICAELSAAFPSVVVTCTQPLAAQSPDSTVLKLSGPATSKLGAAKAHALRLFDQFERDKLSTVFVQVPGQLAQRESEPRKRIEKFLKELRPLGINHYGLKHAKVAQHITSAAPSAGAGVPAGSAPDPASVAASFQPFSIRTPVAVWSHVGSGEAADKAKVLNYHIGGQLDAAFATNKCKESVNLPSHVANLHSMTLVSKEGKKEVRTLMRSPLLSDPADPALQLTEAIRRVPLFAKFLAYSVAAFLPELNKLASSSSSHQLNNLLANCQNKLLAARGMLRTILEPSPAIAHSRGAASSLMALERFSRQLFDALNKDGGLAVATPAASKSARGPVPVFKGSAKSVSLLPLLLPTQPEFVWLRDETDQGKGWVPFVYAHSIVLDTAFKAGRNSVLLPAAAGSVPLEIDLKKGGVSSVGIPFQATQLPPASASASAPGTAAATAASRRPRAIMRVHASSTPSNSNSASDTAASMKEALLKIPGYDQRIVSFLKSYREKLGKVSPPLPAAALAAVDQAISEAKAALTDPPAVQVPASAGAGTGAGGRGGIASPRRDFGPAVEALQRLQALIAKPLAAAPAPAPASSVAPAPPPSAAAPTAAQAARSLEVSVQLLGPKGAVEAAAARLRQLVRELSSSSSSSSSAASASSSAASISSSAAFGAPATSSGASSGAASGAASIGAADEGEADEREEEAEAHEADEERHEDGAEAEGGGEQREEQNDDHAEGAEGSVYRYGGDEDRNEEEDHPAPDAAAAAECEDRNEEDEDEPSSSFAAADGVVPHLFSGGDVGEDAPADADGESAAAEENRGGDALLQPCEARTYR